MNGDADVIVATKCLWVGYRQSRCAFCLPLRREPLAGFLLPGDWEGRTRREKAEAVLFFRQQDMGVHQFHSAEGKLEIRDVQKVAEVIADQDEPVKLNEISHGTDLSERKLTSVVHRLEDVGALEILPTGDVQLFENVDTSSAAQAAAEAQEQRKEMKQERLRRMQEYADISSCRREHLLRYFGDDFSGPCHKCDNCASNAPGIEVDSSVGTRREVA